MRTLITLLEYFLPQIEQYDLHNIEKQDPNIYQSCHQLQDKMPILCCV